jgi:hypothetical protein
MDGSTIHDSSVTRIEVIDALEPAFDQAPLTRTALITAARDAAAPTQVVQLLESLPERVYRRPADMWDELPGVPIER